MPAKEKERRKKKRGGRKVLRGEGKKAMVALLVFMMATLRTKKLFDGRGQFGSNVS